MVTFNYKIIVWVRLHCKPSGLKCEMTITPLEWVLGRDNINVQFHFVSEIIEGNICIQKIETANNLADIFIKVILTIKFKQC